MKAIRLVQGLLVVFCSIGRGCTRDSVSQFDPKYMIADSAGIEILSFEGDAFEGLPVWVAGSPTVLVGADESVPPEHARMLERAASARDGARTELVIVPEAGHGFSQLAHHEGLIRRVVDWFVSTLGAGPQGGRR